MRMMNDGMLYDPGPCRVPTALSRADLQAVSHLRRVRATATVERRCRRWAILEKTDIASRPKDAQAWYLFAEASRLMYADRDRYVADPAFVRVPVDGLLDAADVASRAALIGKEARRPMPACARALRRNAARMRRMKPPAPVISSWWTGRTRR